MNGSRLRRFQNYNKTFLHVHMKAMSDTIHTLSMGTHSFTNRAHVLPPQPGQKNQGSPTSGREPSPPHCSPSRVFCTLCTGASRSRSVGGNHLPPSARTLSLQPPPVGRRPYSPPTFENSTAGYNAWPMTIFLMCIVHVYTYM